MRDIPDTVSAAWRDFYAEAPDPAQIPGTPAPDDLESWLRVQQAVDARMLDATAEALASFRGQVVDRLIAAVPVIEVTPTSSSSSRGSIVYLHGGAYTLYSARARLTSALPIADRTGTSVVAVDYTLAPQARWPVALDQVISVIEELVAEGRGPIALYGDSAGGSLAVAVSIRMRRLGFVPPKALVLWSPWSDIAAFGDSYATLGNADTSFLYDRHLANAARAYADPDMHRHPEVSPVYADFTLGFPPTLIQGGTREIFLSNCVRLYRALTDARQSAVLDLYEGMPHAFQAYPAQMDSPESRTALDITAKFLTKHLAKATSSPGSTE
jgi:monoterpene epsilon-lactone hydrolase